MTQSDTARAFGRSAQDAFNAAAKVRRAGGDEADALRLIADGERFMSRAVALQQTDPRNLRVFVRHGTGGAFAVADDLGSAVHLGLGGAAPSGRGPFSSWAEAEAVADLHRARRPHLVFTVAPEGGTATMPRVVTDEGACVPLWRLLHDNAGPGEGDGMSPDERAEMAAAIYAGEVYAVPIGGGWSTISPADKGA